jgi:co-chaperonin GroES (HSP10)
MKEQSSILKTPKPKIEVPDNSLVGVKSEKKEEGKIPNPTVWRLLVLPFKMKEKTKGGIVLAETTLEKQQVASQCGLVLAMGPDCYRDKERYPDGPWCKKGDWVMFARYAGSPEDILHEF